jgi:hypothetical protein
MRRATLPLTWRPPTKSWGANCGPTALAALLGREVETVREALQPWPGYTNPTKIKSALGELGYDWRVATEPGFFGLAFVQWCGPWEAVTRAAYRRTHWIAFRRRTVGPLCAYDCNWGEAGGWSTLDEWGSVLAPVLLPKGSTGWRYRLVLEVRPREEGGAPPAPTG